MERILIRKPPGNKLQAEIPLDRSKSLSNRALIIMALAGKNPNDWLSGLSGAKDTQTLSALLADERDIYDAGDAGTVFRFLTAFLSLKKGVQVLTGSERMLERPIGPLVDALRCLGAKITYMGEKGYPPLRIGAGRMHGGILWVDVSVSSQFLSALLMIGPYLFGGLQLRPSGRLVSRPYIEMTLRMMRYFGVQCSWGGNDIRVEEGAYQPKNLEIEADWSAASYWYAMAALSGDVDLVLKGLYQDSMQGDAVVQEMAKAFGIETSFEPGGVRIRKSGLTRMPDTFEWNFLECPDIVQTLAVWCAGLGVPARMSGLETLAIKETNRIEALQIELGKMGVQFEAENPLAPLSEQVFRLNGQALWHQATQFATYGDHRMALSFAPLACLAPVQVENPNVVSKSYPAFWGHLKLAGFEMSRQESEL